MNNYLIPPWGEPKGSPIKLIGLISPVRLISPISPISLPPPFGGIEGGLGMALAATFPEPCR